MKKLFFAFLCLISIPVLAVGTGAYKYYPRKKLEKNADKILKDYQKKHGDKALKVKVVDEIVRIWKSQELKNSSWIRFDTKHFRCIIRKNNSGEDSRTGFPKGYDLIRQIHDYHKDSTRKTAKSIKKHLFSKKKAWKHYGLVALYGKLERSNQWGEISKTGKENGVKPEQIVLVVDIAKVPRDRFLKLYKKK